MQGELAVLLCPYCGLPALRRLESEVLERGFPGRWIWVCSNYPECDARVGCHQGTSSPLGSLANKRLRELRMKVHGLFDPLWVAKMKRDGIYKGHARRMAYKWLGEMMSLNRQQCHVALFNEEQCEQAIQILIPYEGARKRWAQERSRRAA